jgi:CBS domain-containing protein
MTLTKKEMAHPGLDSHNNLWTDVKCGDLVKGQKVFTVDSEATVEEAAEVLVKNGISSAPVYHRATNS